MPWSSFFECQVLSQPFHSPLSLTSRGSLVLLHFLPQGWCHLHIWGYWYFFQQSWFQLVLHWGQHFTWCTLDKLNKQGDNIQPWHTPFPIWNQSVFPCLVLIVASWPAIDFSGGRSGGLVFPSLRWVQLCGSLSILWHCLFLGLEWKLTFSSPVDTAAFSKFSSILSAALSQHHLLGFEIAQLEFHHLH